MMILGQLLLAAGVVVVGVGSRRRGDGTGLSDPRLHVVPGEHYPGDASNAHLTREQHAAMARDLEPVIRRVMGW